MYLTKISLVYLSVC